MHLFSLSFLEFMVSWLPPNIWDPLLFFRFKSVCCQYATLVSPSLWKRVLSRKGEHRARALCDGNHFWSSLLDPHLFSSACIWSSYLIQHCSLSPLLLFIPLPSAIFGPYPKYRLIFPSIFLSNPVKIIIFNVDLSLQGVYLQCIPSYSSWILRLNNKGSEQYFFSSTGPQLGKS